MSTASTPPTADSFAEQQQSGETQPQTEDDGRKPFVEPEISVPVDVLEATTFFQTATSGVTNN